MKTLKTIKPEPISKRRIRWTDTERWRFEEALSLLYLADTQKRPGWKRRMVENAEEQVILPERRRGWKSLQRTSQALFKRFLSQPPRPLPAPLPTSPEPAPPAPLPVAAAPAAPPAPPPMMPAPAVEGALISCLGSVESLMRSLARAVEKVTDDGGLAEFLGRFHEALPSAIAPASSAPPAPRPPSPPVTPPPKPATKPRNIRIAVVGFLNDQFRHLQEKVSELPVDLIAIDKDRAATSFPVCDRIILERHIDHRWSEMARRLLPNSSMAFVHGISEAAQRVADFHSRSVAEARNASPVSLYERTP